MKCRDFFMTFVMSKSLRQTAAFKPRLLFEHRESRGFCNHQESSIPDCRQGLASLRSLVRKSRNPRDFLHPKNERLCQTSPFKARWRIVFLILGAALVFTGISSADYSEGAKCYTCPRYSNLLIESSPPEVIYRQYSIFGCDGCADTTIYRTMHFAAPRPEAIVIRSFCRDW